MVAAGDEARFGLRALQDHAGLRLCRRQRDRLVEQRLVLDDAARLDAAARREHHLRLGIVEARGKLLCREAAEHHRMNGAEARTGEHRDQRLRHHRHVEDDAVAARDPKVGEHTGERLHFVEQLRVGEPALLSRNGRIIDDGRLTAASAQDMPIESVETGVADGADIPAAVDTGCGIKHLRGLLDPVDGFGRLAPKCDRIAQRALIDLVTAGRADARCRARSFAQADLPRFSRHVDRHIDAAAILLGTRRTRTKHGDVDLSTSRPCARHHWRWGRHSALISITLKTSLHIIEPRT
jgi:hypothetical protein